MKIVANYHEWKQAVNAEYQKLSDMYEYLNEKGLERYKVFAMLENLAAFCETAEDLLKWIDSKEGFNKYDIASIESGYAANPISRLRKIAANAQ